MSATRATRARTLAIIDGEWCEGCDNPIDRVWGCECTRLPEWEDSTVELLDFWHANNGGPEVKSITVAVGLADHRLGLRAGVTTLELYREHRADNARVMSEVPRWRKPRSRRGDRRTPEPI